MHLVHENNDRKRMKIKINPKFFIKASFKFLENEVFIHISIFRTNLKNNEGKWNGIFIFIIYFYVSIHKGR